MFIRHFVGRTYDNPVKYTFLALIFAVFAFDQARADSFMPPEIEQAMSPSKTAIVTVIPARLSCGVGETACEPAARAVVSLMAGPYRANGYAIRLLNPEAPSAFLITDDGERLLTLNDYASVGHGPNAIVVYRRDGTIVARYALTDFLPEVYVNGLPRTASSIRWQAGAASIEPETRVATIPVFLMDRTQSARRMDLRLDLDTGELEKPTGPAWENAIICARPNSWIITGRKSERARDRYAKKCH